MEEKVIKWYPCKDKAIIPTKRKSDSGFDVYATEPITISSHTTVMVPTGLKVILPDHIWLRAADRGSTGSKGLHVHCGIIDEQYTGEIFIALCNTNDYDITTNAEPQVVASLFDKVILTGLKHGTVTVVINKKQ